MSRLAQLVERKTLNLVVVGSSPTVGVNFFRVALTFFFLFACCAEQITIVTAPVAQLAARGSHNPKVASSILVGSKNASIAQSAEHALSKRKVASSTLAGGSQSALV